MVDLKLFKMVVVYVLGIGYVMRMNIISSNQIDRMIQVCVSFLIKGEGIKNEELVILFKFKVGLIFC